jgi:hypothetical protein
LPGWRSLDTIRHVPYRDGRGDETQWQEYAGDADLASEVPLATKYVGRPLLLVCAERAV